MQNVEQAQAVQFEELLVARQLPNHERVHVCGPVFVKLLRSNPRPQIILEYFVDLVGADIAFILTYFTLKNYVFYRSVLQDVLSTTNVTQTPTFPIAGFLETFDAELFSGVFALRIVTFEFGLHNFLIKINRGHF